jgi:hypothetical protein
MLAVENKIIATKRGIFFFMLQTLTIQIYT